MHRSHNPPDAVWPQVMEIKLTHPTEQAMRAALTGGDTGAAKHGIKLWEMEQRGEIPTLPAVEAYPSRPK